MNHIWAIFRFVAVLAALLFPQLASAGVPALKAETRVRAIDVVVETSFKATSLCAGETRSVEAEFAAEVASRCSIHTRGGAAAADLRVPGMPGVSARHQTHLLDKHADIIAQLESNAFIQMPQGKASAQLMGEITAATGREVGLWRLTNGRRVMNIGTSNSVAAHPNTHRLIAHTHPNGLLWLSNNPIRHPITGAVTGYAGDVPLLKWLASHGRARQRSTLLIGPTPASPTGGSVPWFTVRPRVP